MTIEMTEKTEQWYRERPARVAAMIEEARKKHRISTSLVHHALTEVSGNNPDLGHVLLVASVLGEQLATWEFLSLLNDAREDLERSIHIEFARAEAPVASRLAELHDPEEREAFKDLGIRMFRSHGEGLGLPVARAALVLQALVWAIFPPEGGS